MPSARGVDFSTEGARVDRAAYYTARMPAYLIAAEERSILVSSPPSYEAIRTAFAGINATSANEIWNRVMPTRPSTVGDWGGWVGPGPRVTRPAPDVGLRPYVTRAAWVWEMPDTPFVRANAASMSTVLVHAVIPRLFLVSADFSTANLADFAPSVNGTLEWWRSGQATVTRTRDTHPEGAGRLDPYENPIGPTTAATHPTTLPEALQQGLAFGQSGLTTLAWLAGGLLVTVYVLPPVARAIWRAGRKKKTPTKAGK